MTTWVGSATWWRAYAAYLASDTWKRMRALVLERDGHWCQGCLAAEAVLVHHVRYDHVGAELAYELKSLCERCHARAHVERERAVLAFVSSWAA